MVSWARGWALCAAFVLPLACSGLKDENLMPPESGGEDGPDGGPAKPGATSAIGGGSGASGERSTETETDAGTGGIAETGGTAGMGGVGAGMGGVGVAGMGGVDVAGMGGVGGTGGAAGMGSCGTDLTAVCVADLGNQAAFYDADGKLLDFGETQRQHVLPDGGAITVISGTKLTSYLSVPAGTTLRTQAPPPDLEEKPLQSIQVTVPPYADVSGALTRVRTGCRDDIATLGVAQNVYMNDSCLVNGKAELLIEAWDKAFIHVTGIELGSSQLEPKVITLPEWKPMTWNGSFTLNGLPDRFQNQVQSQAGFVAYVGATSIDNFYAKFSNSKANLYTTMPDFGHEWWRKIQVQDAKKLADVREYSETWESVGHPLATSQTKDYGSTLAPPQVTLVGREISISGVSDPQIDRVLTTVNYESGSWQIWSPPDVTKIVLPSEPTQVAELSSGPIKSVVVRLEDAADLNGYAAAFEYFNHGNKADTPDPALGRPRSYRFAERRLVLP